MQVEMRTGVTGREGTVDKGQTGSFPLSFLFKFKNGDWFRTTHLYAVPVLNPYPSLVPRKKTDKSQSRVILQNKAQNLPQTIKVKSHRWC